MKLVVLMSFLVSFTFAEVFFEERFEDESWKDRWVQSTHKGSDAGKFVWTAGKFYGDPEKDKGLQTSQDAKFYGLSAVFPKCFSNHDRNLVVQFTVKHEQNIDCGGGYIKLFDDSLVQEDMHGDTPYLFMFGPDICGPGTKRVHAIFRHNDDNLLTKKETRCRDDTLTHLYTFIMIPSNNTYQLWIDNKNETSGYLDQDWSFLPPKQIKDPEAKKPEDWDDNEKIDDPEDSKPEDWDQPEHIPDPDGTKPEDWDDEMDGEWEPSMIDNPEFKGEWSPKQIDNPDYKGKWIHPMIDNPDYNPEDAKYIARYDKICAIGLDLWQVKSGTIFDNFLVTDDIEYAKAMGEELWGATKDPEKAMKDKQDEEERKKMEEEMKETEVNEEDEEDEDDEDAEDAEDIEEPLDGDEDEELKSRDEL